MSRTPRGGGRTGEPPPAPEPLAVPALDAHCHLDLLDVGVDEALDAARAVGVVRVVTVGVDAPTSRWSIDAARAHPDVFAAVAIHPNEAPNAPAPDLDEIERLATDPAVVAIGETGLDYFRTDAAGRPGQEESFRRHIDIAKASGKALMIHDRDAHADVLRVLDAEGAPEHVVLHCFSGDADFARACIERGFVLSFAGTVTFANAQPLRDAAAVTPLDQMLVETDAPFLTPTPYRGRPNGPYLIPLTVRALAATTGTSPDELAAAVTATAARAFAWTGC